MYNYIQHEPVNARKNINLNSLFVIMRNHIHRPLHRGGVAGAIFIDHNDSGPIPQPLAGAHPLPPPNIHTQIIPTDHTTTTPTAAPSSDTQQKKTKNDDAREKPSIIHVIT